MPMIDNPPARLEMNVQEAGPSVQVNGIPLSVDYRVHVNGVSAPVYIMPTRYDVPYQNGQPMPVYGGQAWRQPMYFACADIPGSVTVVVDLSFLSAEELHSVTLHPLSRGIALQREGTRVSFTVDQPGTVTVVVNGEHRTRPLHLFFSPPVEAPPPDAIVFGPGFHDLGYDKPITLTNGQTLYLAPGAWVEGVIRSTGSRNIRIMGRGVLAQRRAGSADYAGGASAPAGIVLSDCQDVSISGIVYEKIRIEHCEEQLFCFRFLDNIWGIPGDQSFPGGISNVTIRDVTVLHQKGGPRSEFTGYAPNKRIENVSIEGLRYGDKPVTNAASMGLRMNEHVADVRYK
jgi:hypothetical protein